jgi:leucyl/phenylalanyl-tRNA--protein transferase
MVLFPDELKISRSLRKILKKNDYDIRVDTAFHKVLKGCASPRSKQLETWITAPMMTAYHNLHRMGLAHSVEVWKDGKLTGGLYGVALGKMFFGESMFSAVPNSSKVALVHLVWQLRRWSFGMIDCQVNTEHLASLGAREIPRRDFTQRLNELVNYPGINSRWVFAHGLAE